MKFFTEHVELVGERLAAIPEHPTAPIKTFIGIRCALAALMGIMGTILVHNVFAQPFEIWSVVGPAVCLCVLLILQVLYLGRIGEEMGKAAMQ